MAEFSLSKLSEVFERYERSLGDVYYWRPSEKALLISSATFALHFAISVIVCLIYLYKPDDLTMSMENLFWSLVISVYNSTLMLSVIVLSYISSRIEKAQDGVFYLSLLAFIVSTALMTSFLGFFDGVSWLIFFMFNSALFIFIDRKVVVITFGALVIIMVLMTLFADTLPFPIRALRYVPNMKISDIGNADIFVEWFLLIYAGGLGVILLDFLLSAWRIREADLRSKSYVDELTGVLNRRAILENLSDEYRRAQRAQYPLSVAMVDLDHFKLVNDTYGHLFGDLVLKRFGEEIATIGRKNDLVGRYGGEEFLIVFPECDISVATNIVEDLRKKLRDMAVLHPETGNQIFVTISAGLSQLESFDMHSGELISRADYALYEAKRSGRDNIVAAEYADPDESSADLEARI